jgi:hypothetical protein
MQTIAHEGNTRAQQFYPPVESDIIAVVLLNIVAASSRSPIRHINFFQYL